MAKTEQELFWEGSFGDKYILRNNDEKIVEMNRLLFQKILSKAKNIKNVIEFGANIGLNLVALKKLYPKINCTAIEINKKAYKELRKKEYVDAINSSMFEFKIKANYDLVLVKGVLIHINPDKLKECYNLLYIACNKYIVICEYYNPTPTTVVYRGNKNKLFKRDFAGELMDMYPNIKLVDYGFAYNRDKNGRYDDFTWFLLKKVIKQ